ncbi:unnamed protein product [Calypogeia fissa]
METLGISRDCAHTAMQLSHTAQASRGFCHRASSGRYRFPVQALQFSRSTSSPVVPPFSLIDEKGCQLGKGIPASRVERLASERSSLTRLDMELMLRRMVRAEEEKTEKDAGEEPDNTNDSGHQLWMNRARNMQTTAQIFGSMMFWIMLFFITSIWDSENQVRYRRRDRDRRK